MVAVMCALPRTSSAVPSYLTSFNSRYGTASTRLNSCQVCHTSVPSRNSYGAAFGNANHNFATIENLDSDGDGYSNIVEINARFFPGDAADHPTASAPVIGVTPVTLPFGNVLRNTAAMLSATVTNTGNAALSVTALTVTGSAEFSLTNAPALPLNVPAGSSAKVNVRYAPTNTSADSGNLAIASNDSANPTINVALTGTGVAPTITVTPGTLDFGSLQQGNTTNRNVTLGNTGNADCHVSALTKLGSADFSFGSGAPVAPFVITPGSSVLVPMAYTPSNVGADSGSLTIVSDDSANPSVAVPLSGTGNPIPNSANITVNPLTLPFGPLRVGQSATLSTSIGNTGTTNASVTALGITGTDFAIGGAAPATPFTVAPGANIIVPVVFTPSAVANRIGTLAVSTTDTNHPVINVALSGAGILPHLGVTPTTLDFSLVNIGSSATRTTSITNSGNASLTITSVVWAASAEFAPAAGTPTPPFNVAAGSSTNLTVRYTPADVGTDNGTITVGGNDPITPLVAVNLTGTGQIPAPVPVVSVTPGTLPYGKVRVGSSKPLNVTVSNSGGAVAHIDTPNLTGSADFSTSQPAFDVAAGASQDVTVQYAPGSVGTDSGTLTITSNDPSNAVVNVSLTAEGVQSALGVTPVTINFGAVQTNSTLSRLVTITNPGGASAQVSALTLTGSSDFVLGAAAPATPFTVAAGANVDVPVNFTPAAVGTSTGTLAVNSDDPAHPQLNVALSGQGVTSTEVVDLDIAKFKVTKRIKFEKNHPIDIRLWVVNRGQLDAPRTATVVGIQNSAEVYRASLPVAAQVKHGRTRFTFPTYTPATAGDIEWSADIQDEDPDADIATATTRVTSQQEKEN